MKDIQDFDSLMIKLASPETIRSWSYGEVKKPETINYRTLRPETGGLFCENIFGTTKEWECRCGKFKSIRYKGVVCDRCGVEVTHFKVRRERMGHIELAAPVSHIWYYRSVPSRMGLLLDLPMSALRSVLYYEKYIVIDPGDTDLQEKQLLTEKEYYDAQDRFGSSFTADMGAEAIKTLLENIDLDKLADELRDEMIEKGSKSDKRLLRRIEIVESFRASSNKPSWMILEAIPVIPPELRPMVQLDGGRFATSDLNDLYRRVINRNNRLKRLMALNAPDIIIRNEKRMLQEAVDALFDNSKRKRGAVKGASNRPLKSISDLLKGKQGRFRQNLLGKRVDYSGRSVIVVGPELKMWQCGLPTKMALELFKPFIMKKLVDREVVYNIKKAKLLVEQEAPEVFAVLDEVVKEHPVMLNRAPTLHRLGIQAFEPVLVEGKAIKLHPLVCKAFNADFDGDQMAVHVPLTQAAQMECWTLMLSSRNLLDPASGKTIVYPSQDMVLGLYYLTKAFPPGKGKGAGHWYSDVDEVMMAAEADAVNWHSLIKVKYRGELIETTPGRLAFNEEMPEGVPFVNECLNDKAIRRLIEKVYKEKGPWLTVQMLDQLKATGYKYATFFGATLSMNDILVPEERDEMIARANETEKKIREQYEKGALTTDERKNQVQDEWTKVTRDLVDVMMKHLEEDKDGFNTIYMMADSGARGSRTQISQLAAMRGLLADSNGDIIEYPILSNFKEGLKVIEFFISTNGARKGLADTALKTSDAGYLTRRLVDIAQDVVVTEEDCGTINGIEYQAIKDGDEVIERLSARIAGKFTLESVVHPITNEEIIGANECITDEIAEKIEAAGVESVRLRSVLTCESAHGVCVKCYGRNLARNKIVEIGEAVGIIAAQSIGQPGTQLTMRTFHSGGKAERENVKRDFLFKFPVHSKKVEGSCVVMDDGNWLFTRKGSLAVEKVFSDHRIVAGDEVLVKDGQHVQKGEPIIRRGRAISEYKIEGGDEVLVEDGQLVLKGEPVLRRGDETIFASYNAYAARRNAAVYLVGTGKKISEHKIEGGDEVLVKDGQLVLRDEPVIQRGDKAILAEHNARVVLRNDAAYLVDAGWGVSEHKIEPGDEVLAEDGQLVLKGKPVIRHGDETISAYSTAYVVLRDGAAYLLGEGCAVSEHRIEDDDEVLVEDGQLVLKDEPVLRRRDETIFANCDARVVLRDSSVYLVGEGDEAICAEDSGRVVRRTSAVHLVDVDRVVSENKVGCGDDVLVEDGQLVLRNEPIIRHGRVISEDRIEDGYEVLVKDGQLALKDEPIIGRVISEDKVEWGDEVLVKDGQHVSKNKPIIRRGKIVDVYKVEKGDKVLVKDGQLVLKDDSIIWNGEKAHNNARVVQRDNAVYLVGDCSVVGEYKIEDGDEVLVKDGQLLLQNKPIIQRGEETICASGNGRVVMRDGAVLLVDDTVFAKDDGRVVMRDGAVLLVDDTVFAKDDGRVVMRDGAVLLVGAGGVLDDRKQNLEDGDEVLVEDGQLVLKDEPIIRHRRVIDVYKAKRFDGVLVKDGQPVAKDVPIIGRIIGAHKIEDGDKVLVEDGQLVLKGELIVSHEGKENPAKDNWNPAKDNWHVIRRGNMVYLASAGKLVKEKIEDDDEVLVEDGQLVLKGEPIIRRGEETIAAKNSGRAIRRKDKERKDKDVLYLECAGNDTICARDNGLAILRDGAVLLVSADGETICASDNGRAFLRDGAVLFADAGRNVSEDKVAPSDEVLVEDGQLVLKGEPIIRRGEETICAKDNARVVRRGGALYFVEDTKTRTCFAKDDGRVDVDRQAGVLRLKKDDEIISEYKFENVDDVLVEDGEQVWKNEAIIYRKKIISEYKVKSVDDVLVEDGQQVSKDQPVIRRGDDTICASDTAYVVLRDDAVYLVDDIKTRTSLAKNDAHVILQDDVVFLVRGGEVISEHKVGIFDEVLVKDGQQVLKNEPIICRGKVVAVESVDSGDDVLVADGQLVLKDEPIIRRGGETICASDNARIVRMDAAVHLVDETICAKDTARVVLRDGAVHLMGAGRLVNEIKIEGGCEVLVEDGQLVLKDEPIIRRGDETICAKNTARVVMRDGAVHLVGAGKIVNEAKIEAGCEVLVEDGQLVLKDEPIIQRGDETICAKNAARVVLRDGAVSLVDPGRIVGEYKIEPGDEILVAAGQLVLEDEPIIRRGEGKINAEDAGRVVLRDNALYLVGASWVIAEHKVEIGDDVLVEDGQHVLKNEPVIRRGDKTICASDDALVVRRANAVSLVDADRVVAEHKVEIGDEVLVEDGKRIPKGRPVIWRNGKTICADDTAGAYVVLWPDNDVYLVDEEIKVDVKNGWNVSVVGDDFITAYKEIATFDPYSDRNIAEYDGYVHYKDIIPGVTLIEDVDPETGNTEKKISESQDETKQPRIFITDADGNTLRSYDLPGGAILDVEDNAFIKAGDTIARRVKEAGKTQDITGGLPRVSDLFEARKSKDPAVLAQVSGTVSFKGFFKNKRVVIVRDQYGKEFKHLVPMSKFPYVRDGDEVAAGEPLCDGSSDLHDILGILGERALQDHLMNEILQVYRAQAVTINEKHIGIIIRQMLRKVEIVSVGDTRFIYGQQVDKHRFNMENERVIKEGGQPAIARPMFQGITKAALNVDSFISAASFQETTKVLTNAAISGARDELRGIKENVIIGHLVPAGTGIKHYRSVKLFDHDNSDLDDQMNEVLERRRLEKESEVLHDDMEEE